MEWEMEGRGSEMEHWKCEKGSRKEESNRELN